MKKNQTNTKYSRRILDVASKQRRHELINRST